MTEVEKYFKEYSETCEDIRSMIRELQVKKSNFYSLTGMKYEDCLKSTVHAGYEDELEKIIDLENLLKTKQETKKKLYANHLIDIMKVFDLKERNVLKYYYLDMLTIKQISEIMELSDGHIKKLKSSAMDNFKKIILNDTK